MGTLILEKHLAPLGLWPEYMIRRAKSLEDHGFDVDLSWHDDTQTYLVGAFRPVNIPFQDRWAGPVPDRRVWQQMSLTGGGGPRARTVQAGGGNT